MKTWNSVVAVAIFWSGSLMGQTFTANLTGAVTDPAGASVPEAQALLKNLRTGEVRRTITNQLGRYTFSQVQPSAYTLSVTKTGFRESVHADLQLGSNQSAELNLMLQVGSIAEQVEVRSSVPLLDTQTSNQSSTLDTKMMQSLPVSNRAALSLVTATIAGGMYTAGFMGQGAADDQNVARFNIFGGRQNTTQILIDGVSATAGDWGGLIAEPGADTVQDLQVMRNTYEAQYGRSGAGVVNMTTRGGGDQFHGTAFEYFRNDHLNANDFWSNLRGTPKVHSTRNQFGGNLMGPIWRKKRLYGLVGFERSKYGTPGSRTTTLPSALERMGNFSETFNANGSLQTVFDPATTRPDPARAGFFLRTPFSGNQIPATRFDTVGANYMKLIPLSNNAGNAVTHANNYFNSGVAHYMNQHTDVRVDWAPADKHSIWARVTKGGSDDTYGPPFFPAAVETSIPQVHPRYHISVGETWVIGPTTVANITLGGGRWYEHWPNYSWGFDMTSLGFSQAVARQFDVPTSPSVSMTNYSGLGNSRELRLGRNNYNAQVNVTKELAAHSIKFGWTVENQQLNMFDGSAASFGFTQVPTSGPDPDTRNGLTGNGVASLLLGAGSSGSANRQSKPATTDRYYGFYVQDAWKVTRRLTFNYGVRYEIQKARTERYNQLAYFDPEVVNPIGAKVGLPNLRGGLKYADANNRTSWDAPYNNFAPRVGLAYRVTEKIVARAGYGISYLRTNATYLGNPSNDGFSLATPWVTSLDNGRTVNDPWSNAFPQGIVTPPGSQNGLLQHVGLSLSEFVRERPTPYLQAYSFDLQFQLERDSVIELGYAGSQGRKLLSPTFERNQLPTELLSMGNALLANVPNPFLGVITSGALSGATVQRGQLLRPYPQYTGVGILILPSSSSGFNSLNAKLTRRLAKSMTLMLSYQFSKAIDNVSEDGSGRIRNFYNLSLERSISGHDFPHSFVGTYQYEIPVGKGKAFGSTMHPVLEGIFGEWSVSGVYTWNSGLPLSFAAAANNTNSFGGNQYPNIADRKQLAVPKPDRFAWFNTSAALITQPAAFTFGNAPRFVADVRTMATNNMDISIAKAFPVTEQVRLQFRAESYNAFNRNQFSGPNTTLNNPNFGQITASRSVPRNIQLALRLTF